MSRFTADRSGWYRISSDGFEYLGTERPDDLDRAMLVDRETGSIYQNSGGNLEVGDRIVPNGTWLKLAFDREPWSS